MTKPIGYFVSSDVANRLAPKYGDQLQRLTIVQKVDLIVLVAEKVLSTLDAGPTEELETGYEAYLAIRDACNQLDSAYALMEAIAHQLNQPTERSSTIEVSGLPVEV